MFYKGERERGPVEDGVVSVAVSIRWLMYLDACCLCMYACMYVRVCLSGFVRMCMFVCMMLLLLLLRSTSLPPHHRRRVDQQTRGDCGDDGGMMVVGWWDSRMGGRIVLDGWMDGWMDGWTDGWSVISWIVSWI